MAPKLEKHAEHPIIKRLLVSIKLETVVEPSERVLIYLNDMSIRFPFESLTS
jgi:hypothetical protein